jgi:multidrug resistance protein
VLILFPLHPRSIFVLAYAVGPLILGPLSELFGRARVLQSGNLIFLIFNFACAFARSTNQMLAFRFLAGLGGSAPLGIGAGVIADVWRPEERGFAASIYSLGPLLGPAVGPVMGGWIVEKLPENGYRWIFWSTTIFCFFVQILGLIFLKETYSPVLLKWQAQIIKEKMALDPESDKVKTVYQIKDGARSKISVIGFGMVRPFQMMWREPILQLFSLYMALIYGIIYRMSCLPLIFVDAHFRHAILTSPI